MKDKEIYKGFYDWAEGKGSESYFIGHCEDPDDCKTAAETLVLKSVKKGKNKNWKKEDYENHIRLSMGSITRLWIASRRG